jgi:transposase
MSGRMRRRRIEPTDWEQLALLCGWPEQVRYEEIRPLVLFGSSVAERASETNTSERTLYRRTDRFGAEGMESLFDAQKAKRRALPPRIRRMIVDLKADHPPMGLGEIANVCYVYSGRKPSKHTVKRVLAEEPTPLRMVRRFDPYHEIPEPHERRLAVVGLHAEGWTVTSIASYLKTSRQTVYGVLRRWIDEGADGLEDRLAGRPEGVRKVDLRALAKVIELQRNPELGEFRVHAALKQSGIHLSPRTCGGILALNRRLYGLEKPKAGSGARKGDAVRVEEAPRILDHRHPLLGRRRRTTPRRQDLRNLGPGEPQQVRAGERRTAKPRPHCLPFGTLRSRSSLYANGKNGCSRCSDRWGSRTESLPCRR